MQIPIAQCADRMESLWAIRIRPEYGHRHWTTLLYGTRGDVIDFKHQMREQHGRGCDVREKKIEEAVVRVNGEFRPAEVTFTEAPAGPG